MPLSHSKFIGITMGCPVGIGPEIILKFLEKGVDSLGYNPIIVGFASIFKKCAHDLGINMDIIPWMPGDSIAPLDNGKRLYIYEPDISVDSEITDMGSLVWGEPSIATGKAMALAIESCFSLVQSGELAAMVTAPISKAALHMAGYDYPGHTEMLAKMSGSDEFAMMMAGKKLRVTLVTIHVGLHDVPHLLSCEKITKLINLTGDSLKRDFSISRPKMAIAALNPHASEGGLFGTEESEIIEPAIREVTAQGWDVSGPFPPDTVFNKAVAGDYDAVICMYHDQGLIPFKLLHFEDGVNVTIGLPTVRTSVDHGTAYDIAGKGVASPLSMEAAFAMAAEIVTNRRKYISINNSSPPFSLVMDEKNRSGKLVVFEGIDGTGKTTQIELLALALEKRGYAVVATREPTDGVFGRKIRELYVSRESVSLADELELFLADRREHVAQVINPALAAGKIVLTDRYYLSTAAYQGAAGMDYLEIIAENEKFAPRPDIVLLLDIAVSASVQRIQDLRQESLNAFEQEDNLIKVDRIFKAMAYSYIKTIDGSQSVGDVHKSVMTHVDDLLRNRN